MTILLSYDIRYPLFIIVNKKLYYKGVLNMGQKRWWPLFLGFMLLITLLMLKHKNSNKKNFKIGILQFVEHEALDASRQGFIDGINKLNLNVQIEYKNAQGDQSNCTLIANQFVAENCDLIFAIATPAAQSTAAVTSKIPILISAVTNPVDVNLVKSNQKPDTNISGTSDLAPISKQIELIKKLKPNAESIGILYSSSEANSKFQAEIALGEAQKLGLHAKEITFSQVTEIQQIVESISGKVDAIYTPTDNVVASNMTLISKTAMQFGIPVICGEVNLLSKGAVGTFGMDYYELGLINANQAEKILTGQDIPQNMPIEYIKDAKLALNEEVLNKLNLSFMN